MKHHWVRQRWKANRAARRDGVIDTDTDDCIPAGSSQTFTEFLCEPGNAWSNSISPGIVPREFYARMGIFRWHAVTGRSRRRRPTQAEFLTIRTNRPRIQSSRLKYETLAEEVDGKEGKILVSHDRSHVDNSLFTRLLERAEQAAESRNGVSTLERLSDLKRFEHMVLRGMQIRVQFELPFKLVDEEEDEYSETEAERRMRFDKLYPMLSYAAQELASVRLGVQLRTVGGFALEVGMPEE